MTNSKSPEWLMTRDTEDILMTINDIGDRCTIIMALASNGGNRQNIGAEALAAKAQLVDLKNIFASLWGVLYATAQESSE